MLVASNGCVLCVATDANKAWHISKVRMFAAGWTQIKPMKKGNTMNLSKRFLFIPYGFSKKVIGQKNNRYSQWIIWILSKKVDCSNSL